MQLFSQRSASQLLKQGRALTPNVLAAPNSAYTAPPSPSSSNANNQQPRVASQASAVSSSSQVPGFPPLGAPGMPSRVTPTVAPEAPVPPESPALLTEQLLSAPTWQDVQVLYMRHRTFLDASQVAAAWSRLLKVVPPSERLNPAFNRFLDLLACATQDRVQGFSPAQLPVLLWALAKLKSGLPASGMVRSTVKALAEEAGLSLNTYDLPQLRR